MSVVCKMKCHEVPAEPTDSVQKVRLGAVYEPDPDKRADTDGCVLVGDAPAQDFLGQSRVAFDRLFAKLQAATDAITIQIREAS